MPKQRIGLLGGTFDPVHLGHLLLAVHCHDRLALDRLIFIPARLPPHKDRPAAAPAERLEMVRLALGDDRRFSLCDCELSRPEPSYTIDTVRHLGGSLDPDAQLFWIIGSDMLLDLPSWHRVRELADLIEIIVVGRAGQPAPNFQALQPVLTPDQTDRIKGRALQLPLMDISSTVIRQRIARGQSIRYFLPESVRSYILDRNLYR